MVFVIRSVACAVQLTVRRMAPLRQPLGGLRPAAVAQRRMGMVGASPTVPDGAPAVDFNSEESNSVCIIGNVGADPEVKTIRDDLKVANMNIALFQGKDKQPLWMRVSMWNECADVAYHFCKKGSRVRVLGRLKQNEWTGADNEPRKAIEVVASDVALVRPAAGDAPQAAPPRSDAVSGDAPAASQQPVALSSVGDYASMEYAEKARMTEQMWGTLIAQPNDFYDNRVGKRNPKAPDFKHKESGWPLWLSSCPGHQRDALAATLPPTP